MAQSVHQVGYAISGVLLGYVSDRYGRLFAGRSAIIIEVIAGFCMAAAPNIYLFWCSRFFIGIAAYGRFLTGYVLVAEWIGPKQRARAIVVYEMGWNIAYPLLLIFWTNVTDYKVIEYSTRIAEVAIFFLYYIFVLESPRWLITHSREDEAERILTKAAEARGKLSQHEIKRRIADLQQHVRHELDQEMNADKQTVIDIWRVPVLLKLSLILYHTWFTHAFIGYASFFTTEALGGSFFTNLWLFTLCDTVVHCLILLIFNRLPRKKSMVWGIALEVVSLTCLLIACMKDEWLYWRLAASVFLRTSSSLVVLTYYLYTAETFPTNMRQAGMGTCSIFARIGSVAAPFVKELTNATHLSVTVSIFLLLDVINFFLILFIPDTGKIQIADTVGQKRKEVEMKSVEQQQQRSMSVTSALSYHM